MSRNACPIYSWNNSADFASPPISSTGVLDLQYCQRAKVDTRVEDHHFLLDCFYAAIEESCPYKCTWCFLCSQRERLPQIAQGFPDKVPVCWHYVFARCLKWSTCSIYTAINAGPLPWDKITTLTLKSPPLTLP